VSSARQQIGDHRRAGDTQSPPEASEEVARGWTAKLSDVDYRVTAPRRQILESIAARSGQFTAESLADELRPDGIGRATVFRTIDLLVHLGVLHRLHGTTCHTYVACGPAHHHHVICSSCDRVLEIEGCGVDDQMRRVAQATGFAIDEHRLEFIGRCAACR
jgi:Fur family transcriptional regulator, ferric uptake regulator